MQRACVSPTDKYKPGFAFRTPEGFRDETFLIPFSFTVPGNGLPVRNLSIQMDDDVPWILRGIVWPQLGIKADVVNPAPPNRNVGQARIRDTQGNPLSLGMVLTLGAWAQSGYRNVNAFGWWFADEVICEPGGALMVDLQLATNATFAAITVPSGLGDTIEFDANIYGTGGNGYTIDLTDPLANNQPLTVVVGPGNAVEVLLATDGGGAIISTCQEVVDAINSDSAALAILGAQIIVGDGSTIAPTFVGVLIGGTASSPITTLGTLIGVKRRRECL